MRLLRNRPPAGNHLADPDLARVRLTPQMLDYDEFAGRAHSQYLPYVMGFNRAGFRSASINTDELGFRFAHTSAGESVSAGELRLDRGRNSESPGGRLSRTWLRRYE